jgi:hypothetical protein
MTRKSTHYRKPNLLVLLTLLVGAGFVATTVVQAAETPSIMSYQGDGTRFEKSDGWLQSIWNLGLTRKLKNWRPMITPAEDGEGFNLARPFGKKGPALQFSSSLPESVQRGLGSTGGTRPVGYSYDTDVYIFIQKRW